MNELDNDFYNEIKSILQKARDKTYKQINKFYYGRGLLEYR